MDRTPTVGSPFGNLAAELSTTDESVRTHAAAALAEIDARIAAICRQVAERHQLAVGADPVELARTLMAQYHGAILMATVNADDATALAPALHRVIDTCVRQRVGAASNA